MPLRIVFINVSSAPGIFELLFVVFEVLHLLVSGLQFYFDLCFVNVQQYSSADVIEDLSFDYAPDGGCTYQFLANSTSSF